MQLRLYFNLAPKILDSNKSVDLCSNYHEAPYLIPLLDGPTLLCPDNFLDLVRLGKSWLPTYTKSGLRGSLHLFFHEALDGPCELAMSSTNSLMWTFRRNAFLIDRD